MAACEDRQTAADARNGRKWRGAFTWALSKAIRGAKGDLTYEALIQQAAANLRSMSRNRSSNARLSSDIEAFRGPGLIGRGQVAPPLA